VEAIFRKKVTIPSSVLTIERNNFTLLIGSCFSENIGHKLNLYRFNSAINPHGVVFNPISIVDVLNHLSEDKVIDMYYHNNLWHSWEHNSTFSNPDKHALRNTIQDEINTVRNQLNLQTTIILTLGSAWAYRHKVTGKIVANCHKVPQNQFEKICLQSETCIEQLQQAIHKFHPSVNWIFTISPVRHWKDGVRENNLSKGILHQIVDELIKQPNVHYFPAYELVIDELRDYRFYEKDMLHPNELAIDYVWQQFEATYFSEQTRQVNTEITSIITGLTHRPFHPDSIEHLHFLEQLTAKKHKLIKAHQINWD
jgi:hypothetical protein